MEKLEFKSKEDVTSLVPHKGKMFLLDKILFYDLNEITIQTEVDISDSCMFFSEELGGVPSYVAFEYMAQSISALSGIHGKLLGNKPKEGFIMSVTNCICNVPAFKPFEKVVIKVRQSMRMDMAVTFDCEAYIENNLAVTATLNTIEVENAKSIIEAS